MVRASRDLLGRWMRSRFVIGVGAAVLCGALVRIVYLVWYPHTAETRLTGDGLVYSIASTFLADGKGYVDVFTGGRRPSAHHTPGWVTLLGVVSRLGFRSQVDHQVFTAALGLVLVVLIAILARSLFGDLTGVVAAFVAALYPGFWVLEAQLWAETFALVVLVVMTLQLYALRRRATLGGVALAGLIAGVGTLVRPELLGVPLVVLPVILVRCARLPWQKLVASGAVFLGLTAVVVAPWIVYNAGKFEEPVLLSTNFGSTMLAGNCVFEGPDVGFWVLDCNRQVGLANPGVDRSQFDRLSRSAALDNVRDNLSAMPVVLVARVGRTLGVWDPVGTVKAVARAQKVRAWPVALWVGAFWAMLPLAVVGGVAARRRGTWLLPLLAPFVAVVVVVLVFFGEPRYHALADPAVVVLAAFGGVCLLRRTRLERFVR